MTRLFRVSSAALLLLGAALFLGAVDGFRTSPLSASLHGPLLAAGVLATILAAFAALAPNAPDQIDRQTRRSTLLAAAAALAIPVVGLVGTDGDWLAWRDGLQLVATFAAVGALIVTVTGIALATGRSPWLVRAAAPSGSADQRPVAAFAALATAAAAVMILTGALTGGASPLACPGWPLCGSGDQPPPDASLATALHVAHRVAAVVGGLSLIAVAWLAHRRAAPLLARRLSQWALGLLAVEVLLGGNLVVAGGVGWFGGAHLLVAILLWSMAVATFATLHRVATATWPTSTRRARGSLGSGQPGSSLPEGVLARSAFTPGVGQPVFASSAADATWLANQPRSLNVTAARRIVADYVALTKPGILTLLLTTMLCSMLIADPWGVSFSLMLATLVGGTLVAGGANVLNCFIDRDIDAVMSRTRHRASAAGRISPPAVLAFGLALTALAVVELGLLVNWLAAGLALAGNVYYVLVYTRWLKRTTPHNVVIGGAAGAVPPLVGWAAATGSLAPAAWLLFAVIFAWTPPHSWALALLKQGEYGRAEVPMLPVVAGEAATRRQIVLYSILLFAVCLLLVPFGLGPIYLAAAIVFNALFLGFALRLLIAPSKRSARRLFFYSLWYLALIFAAAVADRLILG